MSHMHSISLNTEQSIYARSLPNFSRFVQECLRLHSIGELEVDFTKLKIKKKEMQQLEYLTSIEKRLANIEDKISQLSD